MTFKKHQILRQLHYLAIIFFLIRATFFDKYIFTIIGIIIGLTIFALQLSRLNIYKNSFIYIILAATAAIITYYNNGFFDGLIFFPMTLACVGIAKSIHENGISHKFTIIIFYFLTLYFFINIFFGVYPDNIFSNSRNHISAMFINLFALIVISSHINKIKLNFVHCIVLLICCLLSLGVSGVVVSLFIFFASFQYKYLKFFTRHISAHLIFNLILITFFLIFWSYPQTLIELYSEEGSDLRIKYSKSLVDIYMSNPRHLINMEYLRSLDFKNFILGKNLNFEISGFHNFHNSLIILHARAGIFIFGFIIFFIYALIKNFYKHFMLYVCLLAILLRSLTDTILFSGYHYEYIYIYLLLFSYKEKFKNKA